MIKILYTDDEPSLLDIAKQFLEKSGEFLVTTTLSAPEAIRLLEQEKFDAIISDYQMPEMDGIQFLVEVRSRFGPIPFILFTGRGREEIVIQAINSGADFYLQKGGEPKAQFAELTHKIKSAASRKRGEDALRRSEEKFRMIVENSHDIIYTLTADGEFIFVSPAWTMLLGHPVSQVIGQSFMKFVHPDDIPRCMLFLKSVIESGEQQEGVEYRVLHINGVWDWHTSSAVPIKDETGTITGFYGIARDITDRKRAEKAIKEQLDSLTENERTLRLNEERLLMAQEIGHTGCWEYNLETDTIWGSAEAHRIFGLSPDAGDFPADDVESCIQERERVHQALVDLIHTGKKYDLEFIINPADGSAQKVIHSIARLEKDAQENTLMVVGVIQDITGRKLDEETLLKNAKELHASFAEITASEEELRANLDELSSQEQALRESEEKLAAIVAGSPVPKFVIDRDHRIIYWNRALEQTTGISAAQVIGTREQWRAFYPDARPTMADLILDGTFDRISELYAGKFSESPVVDGAFEATDFFPHMGDSGTWLRFMAAPIKNQHGVILGAVETLIEVTDIKRAELELETKNDELQAANEQITATEEELRANLDELTWQERALRETEERYRNIVKDQTEFICRFLPDGTHVFVNDAYCRYFGVTSEDILGHTFSPVLYPDDRKAVATFFATLTPKKPVGNIDHRIIMLDGAIRWQRWSDRAIFDDKGNVVEYQSVGRDITEYKEAEERYRNIVEDQTEFICRFLPDGTHIFVNDAYCRYFGVARDDILGHTFSPGLYPDDRKAVAAFFATLTPEKPVGMIDHRIIMPDGTLRWQRWSDRAIFDDKGNVVEYQSVGRDITEYKEVEARLQTTSKEYQNLLENITDVYYRSDAQGRLILASQSWATLLNYPELSGCIGKNIAGSFYANPGDRTPFLEAVYQNGYVTDYEITLKKKDGTPVTVATSSYLYFDTAGHVLGVEGTFRDITERKRIIESLKETERRLTDIISFLPDATFAIDSDGKVIFWNHAIEELTGVPAGDMIGKGNFEYALPFYGVRRPILIDLIETADSELEKNYSSVRRNGKILTAETGMANVGGKNRILWGKASPLYNSRNEVTGAIESIRDFTEQRILEDSLKQVNKKLNLMSSITRHDILNNITVCLGYLELAKYKSPTPDTQKLIDILEQNIGAIQSQIDFTKVYQDLGITAPVWQGLGGLLRGCSATGTIPIRSEISNLQIYADPLIGKVFYNLQDNAVRHGQHVTEIHVRVEERGKDLVIIWEDDGVGVLQNEKEKIFNRGFGKNTGLGLFLVREILSITGMSIIENGVPGKGARFEILMPSGSYRHIPAALTGKLGASQKKNPDGGAGHGQ